MAEHWMQKAFANSHGQFKAKAKRAGMGTEAFARKEKNNPKASTKTKRQANLAELGEKYGGGHHHNPHASQPHPPTNPGEYDNEAHLSGPPMAHRQENPGEADMYTHPRIPMGHPHEFRPPATSNAHGYRHTHKHGALRMSGHPRAHCIGRK